MSNLPAEVHNLFTARARQLVMTNYVGGRKRLDDTPHSREMWHHYLYLRSYGPSNDRAKNLRLLRRLTKQGLLVESRSCEFKLPMREQVNDFCEAALRHWLAEGYEANRTMMPPGTCDPSEYAHWNSAESLPPVGCPIVLRIGCAVVQAERTAHIERRDREMTYKLPTGQELVGRYPWTYR